MNCLECEDPLTDKWLEKFSGIAYCATCVEDLGEPPDTDIEQKCSQCQTPLDDHHQNQCPVCEDCGNWCGHLIAYNPTIFDSEGTQLLDWPDQDSIEQLIEAHEEYGSAYWEAKERIANDEVFLPRWAELQERNSASLKGIYGDHWRFEDHDEWASESYEWTPLIALLDGIPVHLIDTEGGGAAGAGWESQNVYVEDSKAAKSRVNQNAAKGASFLQKLILQIAEL